MSALFNTLLLGDPSEVADTLEHVALAIEFQDSYRSQVTSETEALRLALTNALRRVDTLQRQVCRLTTKMGAMR